MVIAQEHAQSLAALDGPPTIEIRVPREELVDEAAAVGARREGRALTETIRAAHAASKGTYGAPRLHVDLAEAGT